MRDLIVREFGVRLAVRTVGTYLQRWGYTSKKSQRHARDQDPEEVQEWLEITYPKLEKRAETEGADIFWDAYSGCGYAREGVPATLEVPEAHLRMNQILAVSNSGEVRFMTYSQTMTALFIVFLERLLCSTTKFS